MKRMNRGEIQAIERDEVSRGDMGFFELLGAIAAIIGIGAFLHRALGDDVFETIFNIVGMVIAVGGLLVIIFLIYFGVRTMIFGVPLF